MMSLRLLSVLVGAVAFSFCWGDLAAAHEPNWQVATVEPNQKADQVIIVKSERRLSLMRDGSLLRRYVVALGWQPNGPKVQDGDRRTPEGRYQIDWRNPESKFHLSLHISYPGPADLERARALGVEPGSMIMIHGLPNGLAAEQIGHPRIDWTHGCIAVTNEEIEEIWRLVDDGTLVIIRP